MDSDAPPVPEPPIKRDGSGPSRVGLDAPRRKAKTSPPPPPGSAARKALEDKSALLRATYGESDGEPDEVPRPPVLPARPPPVPRPRTGPAAIAGRPRAPRSGEPLDLTSLPEADKTKENRGAVGIKHDKNTSITTNAASGTIGETPPPIFDRSAIAAGQRGALAGERLADWPGPPGDPVGADAPPSPRLGSPGPAEPAPPRTPDRTPVGKAPAGIGQGAAARGTPTPGSLAGAAPPGAGEPEPRRAVPIGEFDHDTVLEQDKLRVAHAQATTHRDLADALLGLSEPAAAPAKPPPSEVLFDDPTMIKPRTGDGFDDPTTIKPRTGGGGDEPTHKRAETGFDEPTRKRAETGFDEPTRKRADAAGDAGDAGHNASGASTGQFERGDPTAGDRDDATAISAPAAGHAPTGTLRSSATLRRRRGIAGDVRYVATVVFGLRDARRETAAIAARQVTRQQSRRHHLVTLGRAAATAESFEHPALGAAREQLSSVEDERSQHAGHVVAADAELARVRRDREAKAKQHTVDLAALDAALAAIGKKLEPLEKAAFGIRKRAADLHEALRQIDAKIAATEASLGSVKGGKLDRAQVQAEIATLKADRKAIQADEPVIAGELDAVNPRIAALEAARAEAQAKRAELETSERDDQRRVEELLAAIGAKRKVVDRAAADAEVLRDKVLFQLGERLYVDRPGDLTAELAPIDQIDLEIGSADRRTMELREIIASVDRWKLARGIALLAVVVAVLGAVAVALAFPQLWRR